MKKKDLKISGVDSGRFYDDRGMFSGSKGPG